MENVYITLDEPGRVRSGMERVIKETIVRAMCL